MTQPVPEQACETIEWTCDAGDFRRVPPKLKLISQGHAKERVWRVQVTGDRMILSGGGVMIAVPAMVERGQGAFFFPMRWGAACARASGPIRFSCRQDGDSVSLVKQTGAGDRSEVVMPGDINLPTRVADDLGPVIGSAPADLLSRALAAVVTKKRGRLCLEGSNVRVIDGAVGVLVSVPGMVMATAASIDGAMARKLATAFAGEPRDVEVCQLGARTEWVRLYWREGAVGNALAASPTSLVSPDDGHVGIAPLLSWAAISAGKGGTVTVVVSADGGRVRFTSRDGRGEAPLPAKLGGAWAGMFAADAVARAIGTNRVEAVEQMKVSFGSVGDRPALLFCGLHEKDLAVQRFAIGQHSEPTCGSAGEGNLVNTLTKLAIESIRIWGIAVAKHAERQSTEQSEPPILNARCLSTVYWDGAIRAARAGDMASARRSLGGARLMAQAFNRETGPENEALLLLAR